jgi:hypothetical protein
MQLFMPMQPVISPAEVVPTNGKLHLFSLYADFPASVRARWAASAIIKMAGRQWKSSSEMWKLDSLTSSQPIRDMITSDAANADVIVIGVSSLERRAVELVQWLDSVAAREPKRSVPGLLIGLIGDEENKSRELDWTVKKLIRCAQQADRDFIWHWMEKGATGDSSWLADNVKELLARKSAANSEAVFC